MKRILFVSFFFFLAFTLFAQQVYVWQTFNNRLRIEILNSDGTITSHVSGEKPGSGFELEQDKSFWELKNGTYICATKKPITSGDTFLTINSAGKANMPALNNRAVSGFWLTPTSVNSIALCESATASTVNYPQMGILPENKTIRVLTVDSKGKMAGQIDVSYTENKGIFSFTYEKTAFKYFCSIEGDSGFFIMLSGNNKLASIYKLSYIN